MGVTKTQVSFLFMIFQITRIHSLKCVAECQLIDGILGSFHTTTNVSRRVIRWKYEWHGDFVSF